MNTKDKVIHLYRRDPQEALERLNRITGLRFAHWPESLAPLAVADESGARNSETSPSSPANAGATQR